MANEKLNSLPTETLLTWSFRIILLAFLSGGVYAARVFVTTSEVATMVDTRVSPLVLSVSKLTDSVQSIANQVAHNKYSLDDRNGFIKESTVTMNRLATSSETLSVLIANQQKQMDRQQLMIDRQQAQIDELTKRTN